jgi:drug/metabolite transporter (DMT)-like permease
LARGDGARTVGVQKPTAVPLMSSRILTIPTHFPRAVLRLSPAVAGVGLTLASAVFLAWLGVTVQLAYDSGASVGTLLSGRFLFAAALLWLLILILRRRRLARRQALAGLLLGVGYSAHAWLFAASLTRLDAGLVDLLLFTYPAIVMLGAVALRRERWSNRRAIALATATVGTGLVLVGGFGGINPLGVGLALGSAIAYSAYILSSAGELRRTDPVLLTALVTTGAAITLTAGAAAQGDVAFDLDPGAYAMIGLVALVAMAGMGTFVAGISHLGPSRASIVSAVQPALTPVVGYAVFADRLGPAQVLGAVLVVAAVVMLETRARPAWLRLHRFRIPRLERRVLRRLADAIDVAPGTAIVRQGEPGDGFFVIERGRATVARDQRELAELGPGDFFGELALLNGGARTASVVAASHLRVRVISRRQFAPAMRRLPTLARSVCEGVSERLGALAPQPAPA